MSKLINKIKDLYNANLASSKYVAGGARVTTGAVVKGSLFMLLLGLSTACSKPMKTVKVNPNKPDSMVTHIEYVIESARNSKSAKNPSSLLPDYKGEVRIGFFNDDYNYPYEIQMTFDGKGHNGYLVVCENKKLTVNLDLEGDLVEYKMPETIQSKPLVITKGDIKPNPLAEK